MGRIRPLFPEFWDDERLLCESKDVGRAFQWLWGFSDDAGRVPLDRYQLKRGCFSVYDDTVDDCERYIGRLIAIDRLWPYESSAKRYAVVRTACKHWHPCPKDLRPSGTWRPAPPVEVLDAVDGYRAEMGRLLRGCPDIIVKGKSLRAEMAAILWPYPGDPPDVPWWNDRQTANVPGISQGRPEDILGYPDHFPPQVAGSRYQVAGRELPPAVAGPSEKSDETPAAPKPKRETEPDRPVFVPEDAWTGFLAHRRRIKLPLVGRAGVVLVGKLTRWHASGHDCGALLDEATERGWKSPVDPDKRYGGPPRGPSQPSLLDCPAPRPPVYDREKDEVLNRPRSPMPDSMRALVDRIGTGGAA